MDNVSVFDSNYSLLLNLITSGNSLSSVLALGNETGDNTVIFSDPSSNPNSRIQGFDSAVADGGDLILRGGDSSFSNGGDITLTAGSGVGTDGLIRLTGDIVILGSISGSICITSGSGTPEGSVTAPISSIYQRLDGAVGNSIYFKISGVGNVGWVPSGPEIEEDLTANGITDTFTLSRDFYRNPSIGIEVSVNWNGLKLVQGASENGFVAIGVNQIQISEVPFVNDIISLEYLPK